MSILPDVAGPTRQIGEQMAVGGESCNGILFLSDNMGAGPALRRIDVRNATCCAWDIHSLTQLPSCVSPATRNQYTEPLVFTSPTSIIDCRFLMNNYFGGAGPEVVKARS
jgi:hypothetical protein